MARIVQLACARCGHLEMFVVESAEKDEAAILRASNSREMPVNDAATLAAIREQRLEFLPKSLPVGGIITPI